MENIIIWNKERCGKRRIILIIIIEKHTVGWAINTEQINKVVSGVYFYLFKWKTTIRNDGGTVFEKYKTKLKDIL